MSRHDFYPSEWWAELLPHRTVRPWRVYYRDHAGRKVRAKPSGFATFLEAKAYIDRAVAGGGSSAVAG